MLSNEVLKVLESEWVQSPKDENGQDTWGFELKPGAPEDVKKAFIEFLEAQAGEDELQGWSEEEHKDWLYPQLKKLKESD